MSDWCTKYVRMYACMYVSMQYRKQSLRRSLAEGSRDVWMTRAIREWW